MTRDVAEEIAIPDSWRAFLEATLTGTVMIIGGPDSGKSTLALLLVRAQARAGRRTGWLDADPGQGALGPPTTLGLAFGADSPVAATFFVGSTSPRGHMLPMLAGLRLLQEFARAEGAETVVIDTCGLVRPESGGAALKEWELELLRPQVVVALQREEELEHLLAPLRRERRIRLHELPVPDRARRRSVEERAARRREKFRDCFASARIRRLSMAERPVYGLERARAGQLLALLDSRGFMVSLGVLREVDGPELVCLVADHRAGEVSALRFGSLRVDPESGEEEW